MNHPLRDPSAAQASRVQMVHCNGTVKQEPPEPTYGDGESILQEAERLVRGPRGASYDHPVIDFGRTAQMMSAILGVPVTRRQAIMCIIAVKLSRECHKPKRDNRVDMAGYALCLDLVDQWEAQHGPIIEDDECEDEEDLTEWTD